MGSGGGARSLIAQAVPTGSQRAPFCVNSPQRVWRVRALCALAGARALGLPVLAGRGAGVAGRRAREHACRARKTHLTHALPLPLPQSRDVVGLPFLRRPPRGPPAGAAPPAPLTRRALRPYGRDSRQTPGCALLPHGLTRAPAYSRHGSNQHFPCPRRVLRLPGKKPRPRKPAPAPRIRC